MYKTILAVALSVVVTACGPSQENIDRANAIWNTTVEISQEDAMRTAIACGEVGLVPEYEYNYRPMAADRSLPSKKLARVQCAAPPQPSTVGDGIAEGAAIGAATYLGGKVLDSITK